MDIKKLFFILFTLSAAITARAQDANDYNRRVMIMSGYYNSYQSDSIYYMFSDQHKLAAPLDVTVHKIKKMQLAFGHMDSIRGEISKEGLIHYTVFFPKDSLTLLVKLNLKQQFETFRFMPYHKDTLFPKENTFFTITPKGTVYGSLVEPPGYGKVPVVLIIPGAGWMDRNGNSPYGINSNCYKMLSDSLKKQGIASVRYDKRGLAESAATLPDEDSLSFEYYIDDAIGLAKMLKKHYRFNKVFIMGHNEGSLVGMKVAQAVKVDGYISLSGTADRGDKVLMRQMGISSKSLKEKAKLVLDSLAAGYLVTDVDPALDDAMGGPVQLFLRSWFQYTPTEEIKKLSVPVLVLQGTKDVMIDKKAAKKLGKANGDAEVDYIKGMTYVLKKAPEDKAELANSYKDKKLPLCPGLMPAIYNFIKNAQ